MNASEEQDSAIKTAKTSQKISVGSFKSNDEPDHAISEKKGVSLRKTSRNSISSSNSVVEKKAAVKIEAENHYEVGEEYAFRVPGNELRYVRGFVKEFLKDSNVYY